MTQTGAVLMDLDGTVIDSAAAQAQCWLRTLNQFGYPVQLSQVRARIGMGGDRLLEELCGLSGGSSLGRQILHERECLLRRSFLDQIHAFPRADELLKRLQSDGARLVVTSPAARSETLSMLARANWLTAFDHVICKEDVDETKPAPDALSLGLARAGVRPQEALFIASSPYDLAAAHAASVRSVALLNGGWPTASLSDASKVFSNVAELVANLDSLACLDDTSVDAPKRFTWVEPGLWNQGSTRSSAA